MRKIAIQGYEGCFHHIAAIEYFGRDIAILPCDTFRQVASAVKQGQADMGLMAIENSIAGSIIPNYSILQDENLQVAGEVYLPIKQNLMVLPDVELEDIREVESHSMALLQCIDYLDQHPWKLVESEDTALSARHIAQNGLRHTAAIASELAAEMFGLKIIAPEINTCKSNYTRESLEVAVLPYRQRALALPIPHRLGIQMFRRLYQQPQQIAKHHRRGACLRSISQRQIGLNNK